MKKGCFLFLVTLFTSIQSFGQCDTNKINLRNDAVLNLCYENPKAAIKECKQIAIQANECGFYIGEIRAYIRIGIAYDVLSQTDLSIENYQKALFIAKENNYFKGIASCQNNLGLIYWRKNDLKRAIQSFHKAKLFFEKMDDYSNVGATQNNLGLLYEELDSRSTALYWYRKSAASYKRGNDKDQILDTYSNMGTIFNSLKQRDSSLYYSELAIKGYRRTSNKYGLAIVLCNKAMVLAELKQYPKAEISYRESASLAKEIENEYLYLSTLINWARIYKHQKDQRQEEKLLREALPIAEKLQANEQLYKISKALGSICLDQNKNREARILWDKYEAFHLKYYKELRDQTIARTNAIYDIKSEKQRSELYRKKKDTELREQQLNRKLENTYWIVLVAILFLTVITLIFYFRKRALKKELIAQQQVFQATNEERKRISYDLHDLVGSQLSFVVNNLELLTFTDQDNERISRTFQMSQEAMGSLRDTVWALHTENMSSKVLVERMKNVSKRWLVDNGMDVQYSVKLSDSELDSGTSLHVMRIFQEAISNVYKHAETKKVKIDLQEEEEFIEMTIEDFGKGFDPDFRPDFHYGLKSIEERAKKIGASYSIQQTDKHSGMIVQLKWKKNSSIA
ncbi:tetratricopeptide repeat-containing sensor histidine kinase [Fluviicola taffensis]|uniref:histidine kinase n=1 Tax=Fluviicola taffensis (strain DSM 16823 / NCIMB 13979 / RW262) TaxID=755732 RepID=F2IID5_FLUTR|nr:sensor histidine kinase [Fluviicola taffensis]AEA44861.1 histidine kinase [Fluviicola taffensis DSM 16823]